MKKDGANLVEIRKLEGEHKAVWSHAFCFLWEAEFKIRIRSQRSAVKREVKELSQVTGQFLWELERLLKVEVSEFQLQHLKRIGQIGGKLRSKP